MSLHKGPDKPPLGSNTRRELLKYFGIGATVVPIIGGAIQQDATARIIEAPKVELITTPLNGKRMHLADVKSVTVTCEMVDGSTRTISGNRAWSRPGVWLDPGEDMVLHAEISKPYMLSSPQSLVPVGSINFSGILL